MDHPPQRAAASSGSVTVTQTEQRSQPAEAKPRTLRLTLQNEAKPPAIRWTEDTVDNEHMGKKSSKRCCIFHKRKGFGESDSDESDSDTEKAAKEEPKPGKPKNYQRFHA